MMLTIVEADKDLCKKTDGHGGLLGYQKAYLYTPELIEVNSLRELSSVLVGLEGEKRKAVLRDSPKDLNTGRRLKTRYDQVATQWLCLDWDRPAPPECPDYVKEPQGAIEYMVDNHWTFLKGVGMHWQLGNSAGIVPQSRKLSLHMWVWLDKPVVKCSTWLAEKMFDTSMTNPVQIHYTASPLGVDVPTRSGFIEGGALAGVSEDPLPSPIGIKFSEGHECTDEEAIQIAGELAALEPINGERHSAIRHWIIRAVTVAYPNVEGDGVEWLVEHDRERGEAESEVARLISYALTGLENGTIKPDIMLRPDLGFEDEEEDNTLDGPATDEQSIALLGVALADGLKAAEDEFDWLKENVGRIIKLPGLEVARLRDLWPKAKSAFDDATKSAKRSVGDVNDGVLPSGDWRSLARTYASQEGVHLIYNNQDWFAWNAKHYEICPDVFVEKGCSEYMASRMMMGFTGVEPVSINRGTISNTMQQLAFSRLVKDLPQAGWLGKDRGEGGVPFQNGVLMPDGVLEKLSPQFFARFCLGFDYNAEAKCDYWLERLSEYLDGDEERIMLVRQWFHYLLFRGTELQKICVLVGQPRGGKGTIMRVIQKLLGAGNTTSPTMSSFLSSFGLQSAVGKRAILIGDAHVPKNDSAAILSVLKTISGEDAIEVNRKHKEPINVELGTIVMACNELEDIKDESGALTNRYSIINFRWSCIGSEDPSVENKIEAELPGIFNWARNCPSFDRFVETQLGSETKETLTEASNPVRSWAIRALEEDADGRITLDELAEKFQKYYEGDGGRKMTKPQLSKSLRLVFPYSSPCQWREKGLRVRGLKGLRFVEETAPNEGDEWF